jgi:hypothetical protein
MQQVSGLMRAARNVIGDAVQGDVDLGKYRLACADIITSPVEIAATIPARARAAGVAPVRRAPFSRPLFAPRCRAPRTTRRWPSSASRADSPFARRARVMIFFACHSAVSKPVVSRKIFHAATESWRPNLRPGRPGLPRAPATNRRLLRTTTTSPVHSGETPACVHMS